MAALMTISFACGEQTASPPGDAEVPDAGLGMGSGAGNDHPAGWPRAPDWARTARIGGLHLHSTMTDEEIDTHLRERLAEHVSVIELDTRLSSYLDEAAFGAEIAFLERVARKAHALGMRVVVYYPSLEVLTRDGKTAAHSMFKDHPAWVQRGMDGAPNVFYGSEEFWVEPGVESAWMSPNSPYREYYLRRIRKLAATSLDGVWLDATLYLGTGVAWAGAEPGAQEAFRAWSQQRGLGGAGGLATPGAVDFSSAAFRAWVRWRHDNLADFVEDVRQAAHAVDPGFLVIVESSPLDHMDATSTGLDGTLRRSGDNFIRVWEVGGVSSELGMMWARIEDFTSKIAMYKWGLACEGGNPSWSFVYGRDPVEAGLSMAAALATGTAPFEARTPSMLESVGRAFRARWFGFTRAHAHALLALRRLASVGVWYSAASRDFLDYREGGGYGLYITTEPPVADPAWWAYGPHDSAAGEPHLGGWRGAAHALVQLGIPFAAVVNPGASPDRAAALRDLPLLWLPSVAALSDESARLIRAYVRQGGTVLATGAMPGTLDALGSPRARSALNDVFGFAGRTQSGVRMHEFGDGKATYRPDIRARDVFGLAVLPGQARETMQAIEEAVRPRVPARIRLRDASSPSLPGPAPAVHVDISQRDPESDGARQYLYVVNLAGVQQPVVSAPIDLALDYRPPPGMRVAAATVATPDAGGHSGAVLMTRLQDGFYRLDVRVDQFALIEVTLAPADTSASAARRAR